MAKQRSVKKTIKKKKWVPIVMTSVFENKEIGNSYVFQPESLIGRKFSVNLGSITGNLKNQFNSLHLKVIKIDNEKAYADVVGFETSFNAIKKIVRRGRDKVFDSFVVKDAKNRNVRVKLVAITKTNTVRSRHTLLRKGMREEAAKILAKNKFEDVINSIIKYEFQKQIKEKINKIYPIKNLEVRAILLV